MEEKTNVTGARAIVIGATGAIGKVLSNLNYFNIQHLVRELVDSDSWSKVTAIVRRKYDFPENRKYNKTTDYIDLNKAKLEQIVVDMDHLDDKKDLFPSHDVSFCCLGTTRKDAGSAVHKSYHISIIIEIRKLSVKQYETQFVIIVLTNQDLTLVALFSKLSHNAGIKHFSVVSSQGASKNSWFLYPQTKGEVIIKITNAI